MPAMMTPTNSRVAGVGRTKIFFFAVPAWARGGWPSIGHTAVAATTSTTGSTSRKWAVTDSGTPRAAAPSIEAARKPRLHIPWQRFITRMPVAASTRSASTFMAMLAAEKLMP